MSTSIVEVLADAQTRGFLGPGEIREFIEHASGYVAGLPLDALAEGPVVDLGSGGGVPGLVLALELPGSSWQLVDRARGRADWLLRSAARLGLRDRVAVRHESAEVTGRGPLRGRCPAVVARSFGRPAVAAECAAPLLQVGGRAVFSDLDAATRWDDTALGELGLVILRSWTTPHGRYVALEQRSPCPSPFPRAAGVPTRRPLF